MVAIIAVLYFTGQITGTAAIVLGIVAVAFLNQPHRLVPDLRAIRHFHQEEVKERRSDAAPVTSAN